MIELLRASETISFAVKGLADREYLAGSAYSIADIAAYAWGALTGLRTAKEMNLQTLQLQRRAKRQAARQGS